MSYLDNANLREKAAASWKFLIQFCALGPLTNPVSEVWLSSAQSEPAKFLGQCAFACLLSRRAYDCDGDHGTRARGNDMKRLYLSFSIAALSVVSAFVSPSAEITHAPPAPVADESSGSVRKTAVFAGGCFWGIQGVFQHVDGVISAVSGYAGGEKGTAEYEKVGSGRTGHAEAVRITYDPSKVTFGRLMQIYFSVAHDPTQLNRQGPDVGPQYRSTVFALDDEQARLTYAYIAQLEDAKLFRKKIVTTVEQGKPFYPAEAYHQDYLTLHPSQPYIAINDLPKVEQLKRVFPEAFRADPVLVAKTGR